MLKCDDLQEQLSGYIDDELTQQESQRVELHLRSCERCRGLVQQMETLRESIGQSLPASKIDDVVWKHIESDALSSGGQSIGWTLLLGALLVGSGVTAFMFFTEDSVPVSVKLFNAAIFGGFAILFLTVLRQRMKTYKTDPYRKVDI